MGEYFKYKMLMQASCFSVYINIVRLDKYVKTYISVPRCEPSSQRVTGISF